MAAALTVWVREWVGSASTDAWRGDFPNLTAAIRGFTITAVLGAVMLACAIGAFAMGLRALGVGLAGSGALAIAAGVGFRIRGQRLITRLRESKSPAGSLPSHERVVRRWRLLGLANTGAGILVVFMGIVFLPVPWAIALTLLMAIGVADTWYIAQRVRQKLR